MWQKVIFVFFLAEIFVESSPITNSELSPIKTHGHSQTSVPNCDDTINGIGIDWDGSDTTINPKHYECVDKAITINDPRVVRELCKTPPLGYHVCLSKKINYTEQVPIGGPHRPVWVTYGEYLYMPPQRWIHAIEHGAAAFLYNPCADKSEIELFKSIARNCLRKHIISPYNNLPTNEIFNVVTFGCRLTLNRIKENEQEIINYLKRHAIKDGPEFHIAEDGDYKFGLVQKAQIVSDIKDSKICPNA